MTTSLITFNNREQNATIPKVIRMAVLQRDQGKCVQCSSSDYMDFAHIIPLEKGGATVLKNLQLLCFKCVELKRKGASGRGQTKKG